MKAVILVGGEGTRLRPLTCNTPKAMVPVLNRPFLEHVLRHLKAHGVDTVVLALGHLSQSVVDYFGDGGGLGIRLVYSVEQEPLGTAGPVKLAQQYLDERFLVLNGDVFSDFDIRSVVDYHARSRARATIVLTPVENPTIYGVVERDGAGRVLRFVEKPRPEAVTTNMINAGLYVLEPEVLGYIAEGRRTMFEHDVFPAMLRGNEPFFGWAHNGYWIDIGTPDKYRQLNLDLLVKDGVAQHGRAAEAVQVDPSTLVDTGACVTGPALVAGDCRIERGARVVGPAVIGVGCRIAVSARVERSVVWPGCEIGEGAAVVDSVIGCNCRVGVGAIIADRCVVSDDVTISRGSRLQPGSRVWPGTVCEP